MTGIAERHVQRLVLLLLVVCVPVACGKRNAPLPPLVRIPSAVGHLEVARFADDVFVQFTVPETNVDAVRPADVDRVEIYAITADREPTPEDDPERLRRAATLVAEQRVRRPVTAPPPPEAGMPPLPMPAAGPGVDQGAAVVVNDVLTTDSQAPVALPPPDARRLDDEDIEIVPRALVAPPEPEPVRRYYFAVPVSPRGRYGPLSAMLGVPLGPTSGEPSRPVLSHDEASLTIRWNPPLDARGARAPEDADLLPGRPLAAALPATTYDVYEVRPSAKEETPAVPVPLNPEPIRDLTLTLPGVTFGVERCFVVRPVDRIGGVAVRGPVSAPACVTPVDTFPPAAPQSLDAVATAGAISLIWQPNAEPDLAGYLVLRGEAGDETLTPLMAEPIRETSYRDATVRPGLRYLYAVVAVDTAGNRSAESDRREELAR